jgi:hypothetical protein
VLAICRDAFLAWVNGRTTTSSTSKRDCSGKRTRRVRRRAFGSRCRASQVAAWVRPWGRCSLVSAKARLHLSTCPFFDVAQQHHAHHRRCAPTICAPNPTSPPTTRDHCRASSARPLPTCASWLSDSLSPAASASDQSAFTSRCACLPFPSLAPSRYSTRCRIIPRLPSARCNRNRNPKSSQPCRGRPLTGTPPRAPPATHAPQHPHPPALYTSHTRSTGDQD